MEKEELSYSLMVNEKEGYSIKNFETADSLIEYLEKQRKMPEDENYSESRKEAIYDLKKGEGLFRYDYVVMCDTRESIEEKHIESHHNFDSDGFEETEEIEIENL